MSSSTPGHLRLCEARAGMTATRSCHQRRALDSAHWGARHGGAAMTIGTCGWMEREWMTSLHAATKTKFAAKRYMDDILLLMQKEGWDRQRFYADFKRSECYARPLNLEEATDGTFLETFFTVQHDHIDFRLKNVNEGR